MCSVEDAGDTNLQEKKSIMRSGPKKCMKCDQEASVVIHIHDAMCRGCFLTYATHKFRSAFGKSKVVRDQEKVLVAFSGGQCSCAMVSLIQGGLSKRAQKKLRFVPSLIYIDEGAVLNQSADDRCTTTQEVVRLMTASGLPYSTHCLEQALNPIETEVTSSAATGWTPGELPKQLVALASSEEGEDLSHIMSRLKVSESLKDNLLQLLDSAKSLTAKENLVHMLRLQLLVSIAKQQGVTKVILGDCATRLSVRLLSNITQGQGKHLPYEISFADTRYKDVVFVRPLREFAAKEVSMYNNFNHNESICLPNLATKAAPSSSIERLTESFVTGLQADFPNTVSTIFRTGEKFALSQKKTEPEETCCLCQCPLDTAVGPSSALSATLFSHSLCNTMANKRCTDQPPDVAGDMADEQHGDCCQKEGGCHGDDGSRGNTCCGEGDGACHKSKRLTYDDVAPWLCYGCQLTTRDMSTIDVLPASVTYEATRRGRRQQMKSEICDFLLED